MEEAIIISAELTNEGTIEIIKRFPSNQLYMTMPSSPVPDTIIKSIYKSVDGVIELVKEQRGTHTPTRTIQETITFEE